MENIKLKIFNIFGDKAINESVSLIIKELETADFFKFAVPKDYIFLPLLEEKIEKCGLSIFILKESSDHIEIAVKKFHDFNKIKAAGSEISTFNTAIDLNVKTKKEFNELNDILKNMPDSSIKAFSINGITDDFTYDELEKLFFEAFRILSHGSSFYMEYTGNILSEYLLKGYIEYAGFINVFPATSPVEYEYGKIKIYSKKTGLTDLSKQPKKVLINIDLKQPEKLLESTVLIRDLHNKYNNWDLYLVSDDWKFFDENIYLKYCSSEPPSVNIDYAVYIDDFNPFPHINYELKNLNSRKADLFYSQENLANVRAFMDEHGIAVDDFFLVIDNAFIDIKNKEIVLEKFKIDFPYITRVDFKTLIIGDDFNDLTMKDKSLLLQLSSFYAGGGFNYFLADALYVPSYNADLGTDNYKRKHKAESFDVSIVIPAYNNFNYTKQCVFSIFKNHPLLDFEIIIIDNGSIDETKEYFKNFQDLKNFQFISNKENLGFAKASNLGAKISNSGNILFLNNDTVVSKGAIDELYYSINADKAKSLNIAATGSLLLYPDKKIQQAGIMFEERLVPYNAYSGMDISGCKESDIKNAIYLRSFNALTAACLMVKKNIFEAVGGFDEGYVNGFEDVDLCLKLRESGYKLIFNPKSIIFHFEEKTPGRKKHDIDNINRFMDKWKFKYKRDNYIFTEMDNLFINNKSKDDVSKYIIPLNKIKAAEDKIDNLTSNTQYEEALKLCGEILEINKYNLKVHKKKIEIKQALDLSESKKDFRIILEKKDKTLFSYQAILDNIVKNNKDLKISLDQNEIYQVWIKYNEPSQVELEKQRFFKFEYEPKISIIMPAYNTDREYLIKAIKSVINQTYPNWELCIADDASTEIHVKEILKYYKEKDERIKVIYRTENGHISKASNSALSLATGDYITLLDHDDELSEFALFFAVKEINEYPEAKLIYSDEDKIYYDGSRVSPYFKCDYNPDLFLSQNMISHLGVFKKSIVDEIGGFREGYEGSQDYDLALRFIDKIKYGEIRHIPRVLYHWGMGEGSTAVNIGNKLYAVSAARKAIQDHFGRMNIKAKVVEAPLMPIWNRVIYDIEGGHLVSIIIITHNGYQYLKDLIKSIFEKTSYKNFEIILINNSDDMQTLEYLKLLNEHEKINVIYYNKPFNYSKIINFAVKYADGEILVILNHDMKVINDDWLRELVSHALRPEVGVVGAKLLYPDDTIQHAGVVVEQYRPMHVFSRLHGDDTGYAGRANLLQNYSAVTGACMALKKELYMKTGGMDENLPIAYNDIDFCIKLMQFGYFNVYTPYSVLYNYESKIRGYEDTEEKKLRLKKEMDYLKDKWGRLLERDFAYNINLSHESDSLFGIKLPEKLIEIINSNMSIILHYSVDYSYGNKNILDEKLKKSLRTMEISS
ncbi:MAG: glycosyltransferase [Candidatus Acidulodesulfobacterium ferriphilum]|uniref:Glycosyltransferase n=1 Tax=Candidatus Acidulodesulfobacterium ferriphilum TaxID=2597223 RepID=A0A519B9S9_9DELT|nr:MAG: glycosyltransferase [Candidatus Acidulodesulfobacterium ferriphilum]